MRSIPTVLCLAIGCAPPVDEITCDPPEQSAWTPGTPAFVERTADVGLNGVEGQRISAVDLDVDGDADLIVRPAGAPVGTQRVLENRDGAFVDITTQSGLYAARGSAPGRPGDVVAFGDIDNDGDLDAYAGVDTTGPNAAGETSEIFLNRVIETGTLSFEMIDGGDIRRAGQPDLPAAAVFLDVDRDGNLDLFVPEHNYNGLNFIGDRIYIGDGTGRFSDETIARGVVSEEWETYSALDEGRAHTRSWSGAACDLDGNGDLELLVGSYGRSPNHLWRASGDGTFANVSVESGYAYDDNFTYSDNQNFACFCEGSPDTEGCSEAVEPMIVCGDGWSASNDTHAFRLGGNSATTMCGDLDNDGDIDLVTTEIRHWWAGSGSDHAEVLVNDGTATFTRPGREEMGIEIDHLGRVDWDEGIMSGALFDFDNDGRLDIYWGGSDYPGNRGNLFHNDGPGLRFSAVTTADFFEHNRSHGIATADFDGDGDLDVVVGHSLARCNNTLPNDCYETANVRYFENVAGNRSRFIQVALEGSSANRAAIGARVTVTTADGVSRTQEVGGGHGHFGAQNDLTLHFGLDTHCSADVDVRWPDKSLSQQRLTLTANTRHLIRQP